MLAFRRRKNINKFLCRNDTREKKYSEFSICKLCKHLNQKETVVNQKNGVQAKIKIRRSQSQSHLTAEMETLAQCRGSRDDSFHLPNFPHMAWVDLSALPTIIIMPSLRARFEWIVASSLITLSSPSASPIHIVSHEDDA